MLRSCLLWSFFVFCLSVQLFQSRSWIFEKLSMDGKGMITIMHLSLRFRCTKNIGHFLILFLFLSPCNSVGGDIVMPPFVCGWVSEWVHESVCPSRFVLWTWYRLQFLPNHFHASHVSCSWWEEEPYWFWVTGSKVKVKFGTLSIKPCGHDTDYSFCPITFKLPCKLFMMRGGTLLILGHGVKCQGQLWHCV